jgi:SAM-dependent methyltransferase
LRSVAAPPFNLHPRDPRLAGWLGDYPESLFSEKLYQSIELMERYSIDLAIDLLGRLNVLEEIDRPRSTRDLCDALSFPARFGGTLSWLLERLIETGCIETETANSQRFYCLTSPLWQPQCAELRRIALELDGANASTLDLLDYAASLYPAVAGGEQNGEQGLFLPQGINLWLNYFDNRNLTYAVNNWLGGLVASGYLTTRSTIRVLEIGAGAGSGSEILLHCLNDRGLLPRLKRYLITEPNAFFRRRGQRELLRQFPNLPLEWDALDMNLCWDSQRIAPEQFDLVYGVNVLHVAKDLLFTLAQARQALAPDGYLIISECVRPYPNQPMYPELIFQILDSFNDVDTHPEFRPNPGFLTANQWRLAFRRAGFERTEVKPELNAIREVYPHFFTGAVIGDGSGRVSLQGAALPTQ